MKKFLAMVLAATLAAGCLAQEDEPIDEKSSQLANTLSCPTGQLCFWSPPISSALWEPEGDWHRGTDPDGKPAWQHSTNLIQNLRLHMPIITGCKIVALSADFTQDAPPDDLAFLLDIEGSFPAGFLKLSGASTYSWYYAQPSNPATAGEYSDFIIRVAKKNARVSVTRAQVTFKCP